jgi:hypothetical protein
VPHQIKARAIRRDNEMRVAVTERFFDDFMGLAPSLARKCRELIRQLARTEAASITTQAIPGWRLHKLRSSPFRSISVDMNYRMLVKLEGDVLFIHRVVKHDLADSEHVNRNDAAAPLCTIEDSKLRWDELADALRALGLSQEYFKPLRSVNTEDEFLDVLQTLPKLWADTALSLFEFSNVRILRAKYRLLLDDAELLQILQGDTSVWELYLHPSQRHIVNLPWSHRAAVTGSDLMEWTHPGSCGERIVAMLVGGPRRDIHEHYNSWSGHRKADLSSSWCRCGRSSSAA